MLDYTHCLILAQSALVFFYIFLKGKKERRQLWRFSGHSNHVLFLAEASCWWGCFHYSHLSSFKEGKLTIFEYVGEMLLLDYITFVIMEGGLCDYVAFLIDKIISFRLFFSHGQNLLCRLFLIDKIFSM